MDHGTSKQIISKLSTVTLRDKLHDKLNELRYANGDDNGKNNYVLALQECLVAARIDVEDKLEVKELNEYSTQGGQYAQALLTQTGLGF